MIPGPHEPSLEELNWVLLDMVAEIAELYEGIKMRVYGSNLLKDVNVFPLFQTSDIPASRKIAGAAGHAHKIHPCNFCFISIDELNLPSGYDIAGEYPNIHVVPCV